MFIKELEVKNFKGYARERFEFGETVTIIGDNFTGKTSIAEGILFGLYGINLGGSSRTDNLINQSATKAEVTIIIEVNGGTRKIKREATRQKKVYLDGVVRPQADIEAIIGPMDMFLSAFLPTYVLSLKDKDAREFFMKLVKTIEPEEVLAVMESFYVEPLEGINLEDTDHARKLLNAAIKELESDNEFVEGKISTHNETIRATVPDAVDLTELKAQLKKLNDEIFKPQEQPKLKDTTKLEEKIKAVEKEIYTKTPPEPKLIDIAEARKRCNELERALFNGIPETPALQSTGNIEDDIDELAIEYRSKENELKLYSVSFNVGDVCPTCNQELLEETIATAYNEVDKQKKLINKSLEEIAKRGKASKAEFAKVTASNEKLLKEHEVAKENYKNDADKQMQKTEKEIEKFIKNNEKAQAEYEKQKVKMQGELTNDLEKLQSELATVTKDNDTIKADFEKANGERITSLRKEIAELEETIAGIEANNTVRETMLANQATAKEQIKKLKEQIIANLDAIVANEEKKQCLSEYIAKYAELQAEPIQKNFNKVSIKLFDVVKTTGELKASFKLLYDKKDIGVLSMSERTRLGLEVAGMIKKVTGVNYPTFLDNAESITHFEPIPGQMFTATVVKGRELEVS